MPKNNWIPIAVVALLVIGGGAFWFTHREQPLPPAPAATPPVPVAQRPPDAPLPPAADSDAQVRKLLGPLSTWPQLAQWLSADGLLERWVAVADNLAEDASPRKQLEFAAPQKKFAEKDGRIDAKGYARYDPFTEVVASIDAKGFAAAVRELHPLLESAYHRLGYPDRSVDDLARRALQRLIDAPVIEGEIALKPKGAVYRFSDEKLEALGPVEKHLIRMGPRNTKLIQAKAREIAAALDLRVAQH
ncbi:MAG TPA: DUF3014 domain-containing protein [Myxococcales bacterium]|nr:DUF3014 domain-containing protein [Myxococcales bacterium]